MKLILIFLITFSFSLAELNYSGFIGGSDKDFVTDMEFISNDGFYLCGYTFSDDFPVTENAFQKDFYSSELPKPDGFFMKLNLEADSIIYSTYFGDRSDDYIMDIEVLNNGNIVLAGYSFPLEDFPITDDAYQIFQQGGYECFVSVFDPSGTELIYSTFLGSIKDDYVLDLEIRNNGNIVISGYTGIEGQFPITNKAIQSTPQGNFDGFIAELSSDLSRLIYSTILGGANQDFIQDLEIAGNNDLIFVGITASPQLPTTANAYQSNFNSSDTGILEDAFVGRISDDYDLDHLSYLGGNNIDKAYDVELMGQNAFLVTGYTESEDFPIIGNILDDQLNKNIIEEGVGDVFITEFQGSAVVRSTFFGSDGTDRGFKVDKIGDFVFVSGTTNSTDLPVSANAYDKTFNSIQGYSDVFITKLNSELNRIDYTSYLGGFNIDILSSMNVLGNDVWVSGWTDSFNFPTTENALDTTFNKSQFTDIFLSSVDHQLISFNFEGENIICKGDTANIFISLTAGAQIDTLYYTPSDSSFLNGNLFSAYPVEETIYNFIARTTNGKLVNAQLTIEIADEISEDIFGPIIVHIDSLARYFVPNNEVSHSWEIENGVILSNTDSNSIEAVFDSTNYGQLFYFGDNGFCEDSTNLDIYIAHSHDRSNLSLVGISVVDPCEGDTVILDAGAGFDEYIWITGSKTRFDTITSNGTYFAAVRMIDDDFGLTDTINVIYKDAPNNSIYGADTTSPNSAEVYYTEYNENYIYNWVVTGANDYTLSANSDSVFVEWGNGSIGIIELTVTNELSCSTFLFKNVLIGRFNEPFLIVNSPDDIFCEGDIITIDAGAGFSAYEWHNGETTRIIQITEDAEVWCAGTGSDGVKRYSDTISIKFVPSPPKPELSHTGTLIRCLDVGSYYQWYRNGEPIDEEIARIIRVFEDGWYKVKIFNDLECGTFSDSVLVNFSSVLNTQKGNHFYPNPVENEINFYDKEFILGSDYIIINLIGEKITSGKILDKSINVGFLQTGFYQLIIRNKLTQRRFSFLKK